MLLVQRSLTFSVIYYIIFNMCYDKKHNKIKSLTETTTNTKDFILYLYKNVHYPLKINIVSVEFKIT